MASELLLSLDNIRLKHCRYGPMLYLVNDKYIGQALDRYGEFSKGEADLFEQTVRPGEVVVEVGANLGAHTVFLAKKTGSSGRVVAFEPQRILFQILCANVALNALTNVYTHQAAVGAQPGTLTVPILDYHAPLNFGGVSLAGQAHGESVPLMTIDGLGLAACHFVKIDVEGMELHVLAGAERTICSFRPVLYVENDREENSAALIERLFGWDYRLYWHLPPMFNPNNHFGNSENVFGKIVSVNVLGLHKSVAQKVLGSREIHSPNSDWREALA